MKANPFVAFVAFIALFTSCVPMTRFPQRPWAPSKEVPEAPPVTFEVPKGKAPATLVWIVSPLREAQEIFDQLRQMLSDNPNMRLVVALDASRLYLFDETQKAQILEWRLENRLEVALMPAGSLPLPLLGKLQERLTLDFGLKPEDLALYKEEILSSIDIQRVILSSEELWRAAFLDQPTPGLVAPLGYADSNALKAVSSGRFPWILVASSATTQVALRYENCYVYLARHPETIDDSQRGIFVLDELYVLNREQAQDSLAQTAELVRSDKTSWFLVDLAYWKLSEEIPIPLKANWAAPHSLSFLIGSPAQRLYWRVLAQLRKTLADYQNLGRANLGLLDEAWKDFYALLSYRFVGFFRSEMILMPEAELQDREFRSQARNLYQRAARFLRKKPPLEDLDRPLWQAKNVLDVEGRQPTAGTGSEARLEFSDLYDPVSVSSAANLEKLLIDWNADEFVLNLQFSAVGAALPMLEFYIDLNNRAYEGKGSSLNGLLKIAPVDFWEYAIRVDFAGKALLYRYTSGSLGTAAAKEQALVCQENQCVLKFPRSWIGGQNPLLWGWAFALWSEDEKILLDALALSEPEEETLFFCRK